MNTIDELTPAQARLLDLVRTLPDQLVDMLCGMAVSATSAAEYYSEKRAAAARSNVIVGPWKRARRRH